MKKDAGVHLLLIDSDEGLIDSLRDSFQGVGYRVSAASDGHTGLSSALVEKPDIIIMEVDLPGLDGWQLCQMIRQYSAAPILILSALGDVQNRIQGLDKGADDYLVKPLSFQEIEAHVRALLRRVQLDRAGLNIRRISVGRIVLNGAAHIVTKDGREISMRHKEFRILALLMANIGKVVTRERLLNEVWGADWFGDTRTLDVHMSWLRAKLEDEPTQPVYLQTVRGVGYRFANPEDGAQHRNSLAGISSTRLREGALVG
jgi:DNA-binding response OmpR family regulator